MEATVVAAAHTYEIRGYRWLMYAVFVIVTFLFASVATILTARGYVWLAVVGAALWALWVIVGSRAQRRTPYRLTLSGSGLHAVTLLGSDELTWAKVQRLRFLRSRWEPRRIQGVEIACDTGRKLVLFDRLSDFDGLITQLRLVGSRFIEE
jgi:hypothetical protein